MNSNKPGLTPNTVLHHYMAWTYSRVLANYPVRRRVITLCTYAQQGYKHLVPSVCIFICITMCIYNYVYIIYDQKMSVLYLASHNSSQNPR